MANKPVIDIEALQQNKKEKVAYIKSIIDPFKKKDTTIQYFELNGPDDLEFRLDEFRKLLWKGKVKFTYETKDSFVTGLAYDNMVVVNPTTNKWDLNDGIVNVAPQKQFRVAIGTLNPDVLKAYKKKLENNSTTPAANTSNAAKPVVEKSIHEPFSYFDLERGAFRCFYPDLLENFQYIGDITNDDMINESYDYEYQDLGFKTNPLDWDLENCTLIDKGDMLSIVVNKIGTDIAAAYEADKQLTYFDRVNVELVNVYSEDMDMCLYKQDDIESPEEEDAWVDATEYIPVIEELVKEYLQQ